MKAVLPYDAAPSVRAIIAAAGGAIVRIVPLREADASGLRREIRDADVLLHVLAPVTADVMDASPSLRLVQKIGVGVDAIDLDFAKSRGIAVCNMPGTNTAAVAELTLALMLACLRRLVPLSGDTRAGVGWPPRPEHLDSAGEIGGRCVGLLGYGAVPRKLAPVLQALGAQVIAHDRSARSADVELVSLDSLLERSDILSLHVPLTPDTRGLLGAGRIARMKQGAIVINTARGALIDEAALAQALRNGHLSAAGLDVLGQEPPAPQHPLLALPNVVCTPHVAWLTDDTWRRSMAVIVENCRRLGAGEPMLHRIA